MGQIVPDAVERYLETLNHLGDPVLQDVQRQGRAHDLPLIDAEVGALLRVLAAAIDARRMLEIGTAIGYSGLWLAGVLPPSGSLLSMEIDPERARAARENFVRGGVADRVNVIVGDAQRMLAKVSGPFDLVFQDGNKKQYGPMLNRLVELLRPGGLLVTDNVLWSGDVVPGLHAGSRHDAESTNAIASYNEQLSRHPALMTVILPLRDGVALSTKRTAPV
jgi:predicted O-methyltransferase YrrM